MPIESFRHTHTHARTHIRKKKEIKTKEMKKPQAATEWKKWNEMK